MKIKNTSPSVDDEVGAGVDSEEEVAHVDQVVDDGVGRALVALALDGRRKVAAHLSEMRCNSRKNTKSGKFSRIEKCAKTLYNISSHIYI